MPRAASCAQAAVPAWDATSLTTTSGPSSLSRRPRSTRVAVSSPQAWKKISREPAARAQAYISSMSAMPKDARCRMVGLVVRPAKSPVARSGSAAARSAESR